MFPKIIKKKTNNFRETKESNSELEPRISKSQASVILSERDNEPVIHKPMKEKSKYIKEVYRRRDVKLRALPPSGYCCNPETVTAGHILLQANLLRNQLLSRGQENHKLSLTAAQP
jgi:hypothetical protein